MYKHGPLSALAAAMGMATFTDVERELGLTADNPPRREKPLRRKYNISHERRVGTWRHKNTLATRRALAEQGLSSNVYEWGV